MSCGQGNLLQLATNYRYSWGAVKCMLCVRTSAEVSSNGVEALATDHVHALICKDQRQNREQERWWCIAVVVEGLGRHQGAPN